MSNDPAADAKKTRTSSFDCLQKPPQNVTHKGEVQTLDAGRTYFGLDLLRTEVAPTLLFWSLAYMQTKVVGIQADNTEQAKRRDLAAFLKFFADLNGHRAIELWLPRDTRAFLKHLEKLGRAPTTVNRMLRTLRHFARWVHEQPNTPFAKMGVPTAGIRELAVEEPDAKKLERRDVLRLFKGADRLILTETRKNSRPKRNRAMLAILYFTGLRITEVVSLTLSQWDGKRFKNVRRKANVRSKVVYLHTEARRYLQEYLEDERAPAQGDGNSDYVFLPHRGAGPMDRNTAFKALRRIAQEASKHGKPIHLHPHRLRHTFGFELSARGVPPTEIAAHLGHQGINYVGRYVRPTQEEREAVLDTLDVERSD